MAKRVAEGKGGKFVARKFKWLEAVTRTVNTARGCKVAMVLVSYFNECQDGVAWPTQSTLSNRSGLDRRSVQRGINDLEAAGCLTVEWRQAHDGRNNYRLRFPDEWAAEKLQTGDGSGDAEGAAGGRLG